MTIEQTLDLKIESIEDIVNNIVTRYTSADHDFAEWREKLADARAQLFELEEEALIEGRYIESSIEFVAESI